MPIWYASPPDGSPVVWPCLRSRSGSRTTPRIPAGTTGTSWISGNRSRTYPPRVERFRSEGQVVVRIGHGRAGVFASSVTTPISAPAAARSGSGRAQHDHVRDDDVREVTGAALSFHLGILDAAFDVEPVTFLHPLLDHVDDLPEESQSVPFRAFLLLARPVRPCPVGRERQ